jgi:hypothetical protein
MCRGFQRELAAVSFVLRLHVIHELDELGRSSDAVQMGIALEAGITSIACRGSFSQPLHCLDMLASECIYARDMVSRVVIIRVFDKMPAED